MRGIRGFTLIELMIVIAIIAIIAAIAIPGLLASQRASNERNASASLKSATAAQADFRNNDRDGNKVQDFWTGDLAGLFCIRTVDTTTPPNKLIELSLAGADISPLVAVNQYDQAISFYTTSAAKSGYWYYALVGDDSTGDIYRGATGGTPAIGPLHYHVAKYGLIAIPDTYPSNGKTAFMLNENLTMFKRQLTTPVRPATTPNPITTTGYSTWPTDLLLKTYWSKMD